MAGRRLGRCRRGTAGCGSPRRSGRRWRARRHRPRRGRRRRRAASRAPMVDGERIPGRSCISCTVHSTSDSDPRPSLRWNAGSSPGGIRSRSIRALVRRISRTSSSDSPGSPHELVEQLHEPLRHLGVAGDRTGPQHRLALPHVRPAVEVRGVRLDRTGDRPLLALGSQVEVDVPDPFGRRRPVRRTGAGPSPAGSPPRSRSADDPS